MSQEIHELSGEPFDISRLIWKYLQQEISVEERAVLDEWVGRSEGNKKWFEELIGSNTLQSRLSSYHAMAESREQVWQKVLESHTKPAKTVRFKWFVLAAAASVLLALSLVIFNRNSSRENEQAVVNMQDKNEISAPSSNKAILSLDDGRKIYLDSVSNGVLVAQDNVNIEKLGDGRLAYKSQPGAEKLVYNTLSNPRGSRVIDIMLADGSRVWLNNESSIRFPIAFGKGERRVEITGEAYFEVAKDAKKPFVVKVGKMNVQVLGTAFNINSYQDESGIKTTLVEGSIRLNTGNKSKLLEPGQQAEVGDEKIDIINKVDIDKAIAWRKGLIAMGGDDIKSVFRQIGRWYDVDIEYAGTVRPIKLYGDIPRSISLRGVLEAIQMNSDLQYKIIGNKVIIQ
jgi:transmembrane sensor